MRWAEIFGTSRGLKLRHQIPHTNAQCSGDLHQIVQGWGFHSSLDPADENGGKVGPFSESLLGEPCLFPFVSDRLAQKTAVLLVGRHGEFRVQEPPKATMSLTTSLDLTGDPGRGSVLRKMGHN